MKISNIFLLKFAKVIGIFIGRMVSEIVKDVIAYVRRRRRLIPWPDASTATTLW